MASTAFTPPSASVAPGSATKGFAITPSDSTIFTDLTRYIWVGATGHLDVVLAGTDDVVVLGHVPAGTLLPLCVRKVMAATTATELVGLL